MSAPFPRLTRLLQALGWLPQQTTTNPKPSRTQKPGLERYDFGETGQLPELVDEMRRGELPTPKMEPIEPDFGSYSPSETAKRLKEKMGIKTYQGPIPEPVTHRLFSSPLQESLIAEVTEWPTYELTWQDKLLNANFGCEGTRLRGARWIPASPEDVQKMSPEHTDSYYFGDKLLKPRIREPTPYKSLEHMLKGDKIFQEKPEAKEKTIKDEWNTTERRQEVYSFWE